MVKTLFQGHHQLAPYSRFALLTNSIFSVRNWTFYDITLCELKACALFVAVVVSTIPRRSLTLFRNLCPILCKAP